MNTRERQLLLVLVLMASLGGLVAAVSPPAYKTVSAVKVTCLRTATQIVGTGGISATCTATGATAVYMGGSTVDTTVDNCIGNTSSCPGRAITLDTMNRLNYCRVAGVGNAGEQQKIRCTILGE